MAQDGPSAHPATPPRHRPLVPVLAGFALGIALDSALRPDGWCWIAPGLAGAALALWGVRRGLHEWGHWLLAILLMAALGGFWHDVRFRQAPPWHVKHLAPDGSGLYFVRGRVSDEPVRHYRRGGFERDDASPAAASWSVRVALEALSGDGEAWRRAAGGLAVFSGGGRPDLYVGDRVEFCARLRGNRGPTNPGERDRALAYERAGSHATASVQGPVSFTVLSRGRWYGSPAAATGRLCTFLSDRIERLLPAEVEGLVTALLFGRRNALTPRQETLLKESGTLHFLAISGLHVGLFCLFCHFALTLAGLPVRTRAVACIALVWAYVLFTGCHVSALRAGFMLSLMLAAPVLGRQWDSPSALCGAAFLILVMSPQQLFSPGFQLTFVAVWALICIYPQLSRLLWPWQDFVDRAGGDGERSVWSDLWAWSKAYLLLSCVAWAATAPVRLFHFNSLSLWGPLLNLVMWPLVLVLLLACFALALSVLIGGLGAGAAAAVAGLLGFYVQELLEMASHLPGFVAYMPAPPAWWVGLCYAAMGAWVLRRRLPAGRALFVAAAAVLAVGYLGNELAVRCDRRFRLTVADVGTGQAALIELPTGQSLLFDAGSRRWSAGTAVAEMLWQRHVGRLDAVVLSHLDSDHYNFVPFLAERFDVAQVVLPAVGGPDPSATRFHKSLSTYGLERHDLREGAGLVADALHCVVLHPDLAFATGRGLSENDRSLVVRCDYAGARLLLTGDIEEKAMRRLTRDCGEALRADVLVMPHHAHHHGGLAEFVAAVQPRAAIVSGGETDCHPATAAMLAERGVSLWITATEGAIIVRVERGKVHVEGYASGRAAAFEPGGGRSAP